MFKEYYKTNKNARLTIVGDGTLFDKVVKEVEDIKEVTQILGQRDDIANIISKNDVVLALGRCILETIAMKKIAVISGYNCIKEIITPNNIERASNENFRGDGLEDNSIEEIITQLNNFNQEKIAEVVNQNYKYIFDNFNIKDNIYLINNASEIKIITEPKSEIESIMELTNMYNEQVEHSNKIYKEGKEAQEYYQKQIENRDKQIEENNKKIQFLKEELDNKNCEIETLKESNNKKILGIFKRK